MSLIIRLWCGCRGCEEEAKEGEGEEAQACGGGQWCAAAKAAEAEEGSQTEVSGWQRGSNSEKAGGGTCIAWRLYCDGPACTVTLEPRQPAQHLLYDLF